MGGFALVLMIASRGSVDFLVVLYSINVFITFSLSQLGMVRHWWPERRRTCRTGSGRSRSTASASCSPRFILVTLSVIKFFEGGWITLVVTGLLVGTAFLIKRHYNQTAQDLRRLDELVAAVEAGQSLTPGPAAPAARRRRRWTRRPRRRWCWSTASTAWACTRSSACCGMFPGVFQELRLRADRRGGRGQLQGRGRGRESQAAHRAGQPALRGLHALTGFLRAKPCRPWASMWWQKAVEPGAGDPAALSQRDLLRRPARFPRRKRS